MFSWQVAVCLAHVVDADRSRNAPPRAAEDSVRVSHQLTETSKFCTGMETKGGCLLPGKALIWRQSGDFRCEAKRLDC